MSDETEMEGKIIDFLRRNGESTALMMVKEFNLPRATVNKHLYDLYKAKQLSRTGETPPVWDLMEKTSDMKQSLKPEQNGTKSRLKPEQNETKSRLKPQQNQTKSRLRPEQNETKSRLKPEQTSPITRDETLEKQVRDLLTSGGLKPGRIAIALGQPKKAINKLLHVMQDEGKVQQCSKSHLWSLNDKKSNASDNQERDHNLGSNSGLSQSFDVISTLGEGGYGCVYKVKHKFDGKIYAVKKVNLTGKADSEVKALARLSHPNIVRYITCWADSKSCTSNQDVSNATGSSSDVVTFEKQSGCEESDDDDYDEDEDDDDDDDVIDDVTSEMETLGVTDDSGMCLFIQMEFCEGGTLTTWINIGNLLNKQRTAVEIHPIFHEIICGVEYIHSNNLIHRDLKPDNILFGSDGKVKIGDFGLVAFQTDHSGDPIERSKRRGTPTYMSPEQENKRNYDEKTDIFPLGLIWFEMLWKISTGSERAKLLTDLRNQRFPEGFCENHPTENIFIKVMLSVAPEDRPSAKDIKEKLEMFFSVDQNLLSQKTV